ncbi:DUF6520 family protein [Flavivirga abyssicola]|uniref:DUF6520 family protein n=1 Tax=Flavivirga abyssicola TaxID=3063533 RepID=UPI0026DEF15B|nr:DUF6520 family protein [Flavivirga sp. MEBiC07777]WVK14143.1 DUF6520 family protein [Flavivirga sp. MEBiC07777]
MKSKIFKTVFPAFALILAISASLAFSPVNNDMAEDATKITTAYYKNGIGIPCPLVTPVLCQLEFVENQACTIQVSGTDRQLFLIQTQNSCVTLLYKCQLPE